MIYTERSLAKKLQDVSVNEYNPNWNKPKVEKQVIKPILKEKPKKEEKNNVPEEITFENF